jgi:hypothetical protein
LILSAAIGDVKPATAVVARDRNAIAEKCMFAQDM